MENGTDQTLPPTAVAETKAVVLLSQDESAFIDEITKETDLTKRYGMLVNHPFKSDIQFVFEAEKVTLFAHKFVMITGSPVFYAMLNGDKWIEKETVKIVDISSTAFTEMLNYIYTHQLRNLTESNASEIMQCAHKYQLVALEEIVCDFLITELTVENVCKLYEDSFLLDNKLSAKCEDMIQRKTTSILRTDAFRSLDIATLKKILSFDQFAADEYRLFLGMLEWVECACRTAEISNNNVKNKRELLKDAETLIRFPAMTMENFLKCSKKLSSIYSTTEIGEIFLSIAEPTYYAERDALPYCSANRTTLAPEKFTWQLDRTGLTQNNYRQEIIRFKPNYTVKFISMDVKSTGYNRTISVNCEGMALKSYSCLNTATFDVDIILYVNTWYEINVVYQNYPISNGNGGTISILDKIAVIDGFKFDWQTTVQSSFQSFDFSDVE